MASATWQSSRLSQLGDPAKPTRGGERAGLAEWVGLSWLAVFFAWLFTPLTTPLDLDHVQGISNLLILPNTSLDSFWVSTGIIYLFYTNAPTYLLYWCTYINIDKSTPYNLPTEMSLLRSPWKMHPRKRLHINFSNCFLVFSLLTHSNPTIKITCMVLLSPTSLSLLRLPAHVCMQLILFVH